MKKLNLDIDYQRPQKLVDEQSNIMVTSNYIQVTINNHFGNLEGQKLRIYGRLQRKLDVALDTKEPVIDLEEAEVDLIKEAFKEPLFEARAAKWFIVLLDIIQAL